MNSGSYSRGLFTVSSHTQVGLFLMPSKTLELTEPGAVFSDFDGCLVGQHFLIGAGFDVFPAPEASGITRGIEGGKGVIGPDHFVPIGNIGPWTEK